MEFEECRSFGERERFHGIRRSKPIAGAAGVSHRGARLRAREAPPARHRGKRRSGPAVPRRPSDLRCPPGGQIAPVDPASTLSGHVTAPGILAVPSRDRLPHSRSSFEAVRPRYRPCGSGCPQCGQLAQVFPASAPSEPGTTPAILAVHSEDSSPTRSGFCTNRTHHRPTYWAVTCSRSWPSSPEIVSRASRSISFCSGVSIFDFGPPFAGHSQPVNSR